MYHMFHHVFDDNKPFIGYVNGASCFQNMMETRPLKYLMEQAISRPSAFEMQLHLHAPMFLEEFIRTKLVSAVRNYNSNI